MGPSGSGKTTLLSILAGLEVPTSGSVRIAGVEVSSMSEDARSEFRSINTGFIFQSFRLMPTLTALENVCVPLEILARPDSVQAAKILLERVRLSDRMNHLPSQMSGGEQQRVAIARAFAARPKLLFADEPTGNLDSKTGLLVLDLLKELNSENHSTLVVVTHDASVASVGDAQLRLKDGVLELPA